MPVTASKTCKCQGRLTVRILLLSFITLLVLVMLNLFGSSARLSTIRAVSIKMKSGVVNVFNHALDIYFINSSVFKTNSTLESSTNSVSGSDLDEKENVRSKLEAVVDQTAVVSSKMKHIPLNVTAYRKLATVELDSNQSERSIDEDLAVESHMKNEQSLNKDGSSIGINVRQSACDNCFKHDFEYIIQNEHICDTTDKPGQIDLLILLTTVHKNGFVRQALRRTWLSHTNNNTANVRYVFLLGKAADDRLQESVKRENEIYHDIIQENFVDSYNNLTYKTIMGFKWASTKCSNAKFVMKTDEDMWVNVPSLIKLLSETDLTNYLQTALTGSCTLQASPIRNRKSKWYASWFSYPDKFYPGFCSGTGYVTSIHVVSEIYKVSPHVPFFHLEDVYVALCARRLGFALKKTEGFHAGRPKIGLCDYKKDDVFTVHQITPSLLTVIWNKLCYLAGARHSLPMLRNY